MQTQRCAKCGQDWWDAHACPATMKFALPSPLLGVHLAVPTTEQRDNWLKSVIPAPVNACLCTGPQNGQPLCPCAMRGVIVRDGRYIVPERDLGPVAPQGGTP